MAGIVLTAGTSLEIASLAGLKQLWLERLEISGAVSLELAAVERVDTAGLQFLLGLKHEAEARKIELEYKQPSEVLRKHAAVLGIGRELFGEPHEFSSRP
jgi:ABC-type transporter Mla MlaB component